MPPQRASPENYFSDQYQPQTMQIEPIVIPDAVWILLGIALVGSLIIAYMAIKTLGEVKKGKD